MLLVFATVAMSSSLDFSTSSWRHRATTSTNRPERGHEKEMGKNTQPKWRKKRGKNTFSKLELQIYINFMWWWCGVFGIGSSLDYFNSQKWLAVTMSGRERTYNMRHGDGSTIPKHDVKRKTCKFLIVFPFSRSSPCARRLIRHGNVNPWNFHFFLKLIFPTSDPTDDLSTFVCFFFVRPSPLPLPRRSNRLTIKYFVMINRIGWKFLNCERTRTSARRIVKFFIHSCFTRF